MNLSIHNIEQFKWKIPMKTRFQMSQNGTRPKFCLHHFRRISAKRPIMRFKISLVEKCLIFPLHVPLTNLPFVQHFISLMIFLFKNDQSGLLGQGSGNAGQKRSINERICKFTVPRANNQIERKTNSARSFG